MIFVEKVDDSVIAPRAINATKMRIKEIALAVISLSGLLYFEARGIDCVLALFLFILFYEVRVINVASERYDYYRKTFLARSKWNKHASIILADISEKVILRVIMQSFGKHLKCYLDNGFRNSLFNKEIEKLWSFEDGINNSLAKLEKLNEMLDKCLFDDFAREENKTQQENSFLGLIFEQHELDKSAKEEFMKKIHELKLELEGDFLEYSPDFKVNLRPVIWKFFEIKRLFVGDGNDVNSFIYKSLDIAFSRLSVADDISDVRYILKDLQGDVEFELDEKLLHAECWVEKYLKSPSAAYKIALHRPKTFCES